VLTTNAKNSIEWDVPTNYNWFSITSHQSGTEVNITVSILLQTLILIIINNIASQFKSKLLQRDAASLIAPDTLKLINYCNFSYEFDLSELYARKLRKEIYEQKGSSNVSFKGTIRPNSKEIYRRTRNGIKKQLIWAWHRKLTALHIEVSKQIENYPDFCKSCKPRKKKNNTNHLV
jgi:hypothetical protein